MLTAALLITAKTRKQLKWPQTNEWIEDVVQICSGILLSHLKEEVMSCAAPWMVILLSEVSQKEKDKCHIISLICGI